LVRTAPSFQKKFFLERLKEIEKNGFFNFFYLQRFGVPRLINFYWGLFILRGEYQKAVLSFLCSPGQRELSYSQKIRREIKENWGDWKKIGKILAPFPLIFRNEKKIVDYLKEKPKDFIGALNQIQDQVQLWLFAYASLLFNKKISFYLKRDLKPPQKMPLIFSKDKEDWLFYEEFLKENGVSSTSLKNLKPFPFLQWRKREIKTKEKVKIQGLEIIPEGVIFNFTLAKGIYATTFLAHLFNLVAGLPPKNISYLPVDTKATLKQGSLTETLNCFKEVISPKTENIFAKFL
jgi:tRNA(Glu) U13 pseudouridine synthase TruD